MCEFRTRLSEQLFSMAGDEDREVIVNEMESKRRFRFFLLADGNKNGVDRVQTGIECLKTDIFHSFLHEREGAIKLFINNGACCLFPSAVLFRLNLFLHNLIIFSTLSFSSPSIPPSIPPSPS